MIIPSIIRLLFVRCPFAIRGPSVRCALFTMPARIVATVVLAFDAVFRAGARSYISAERFKRIFPALAYGYSPFNIITGNTPTIRICCAGENVYKYSIFWAIVLSTCRPMLQASFYYFLYAQTTAAFALAGSNLVLKSIYGFATPALTMPFVFPAKFFGQAVNRGEVIVFLICLNWREYSRLSHDETSPFVYGQNRLGASNAEAACFA